MSLVRGCRVLAAFITLVVLQACSLPTAMPDANPGSSSAGKVIVIGKFEITPPLSEMEKKVIAKSSPYGSKDFINKVFFSATAEPVDNVDENMMSEQWQNMLDATWGETYFKVTTAETTWLNAGMFYLGTMDKAWVPGGMSFTPPADAKAVYVGTVRYTRDEFWNITGVRLVDEYVKANSEFKKRFGNKIRLRKALLQKGG